MKKILRSEYLKRQKPSRSKKNNSGKNTDITKLMEISLIRTDTTILAEYGELFIDSVLNDGLLKDIPIMSTIVDVGKTVRNVSDLVFANKLITFLKGIQYVSAEEIEKSIKKWEENPKYRIRVGETLINMINRCDDKFKADSLSKLFYQLVLKKNAPSLFMRSEKIISSISTWDLQVFLSIDMDTISKLSEDKVEPFISTGLYIQESPSIKDTALLLGGTYCITTIGLIIYKVLNDMQM